jgi:hypothetical protein
MSARSRFAYLVDRRGPAFAFTELTHSAIVGDAIAREVRNCPNYGGWGDHRQVWFRHGKRDLQASTVRQKRLFR